MYPLLPWYSRLSRRDAACEEEPKSRRVTCHFRHPKTSKMAEGDVVTLTVLNNMEDVTLKGGRWATTIDGAPGADKHVKEVLVSAAPWKANRTNVMPSHGLMRVPLLAPARRDSC